VNISAIGAHPDDTELGCGGLLIKSARQGHNVFMYTLTRGEISCLDSNKYRNESQTTVSIVKQQ
jgi:LmbE family N-acetylglucosaminyl deacetylase